MIRQGDEGKDRVAIGSRNSDSPSLPLQRATRYGVIEAADERLVGLQRRLWPKRISIPGTAWAAFYYHGRMPGNRCWLYYNQPRSAPDYLAIPLLFSTRHTTLKTIHAALQALDEIARQKALHGLVCQLKNDRISDRVMQRFGWQRHLTHWPGRHFIKRVRS